MEDSYVSLKHIYKVYPNGIEAVHDFNVDIKQHEFIVIVGPSGCGKSTTLRMVAGLEDISSGELYIDGKYSNDETPKDRDIAMVFQSYSLYPHMTVKDNISFGIRMRKYAFPSLDKEGKPILSINTDKISKLTKQNKNISKEIDALNIEIKKLEEIELPNEFILEKKISKKNHLKQLAAKLEENSSNIEQLKNNPEPVMVLRHLTRDEVDERVNAVASTLELEDYLDRKPAELSGGQRQRVALGRSIIRNAKVFLMDEPLSNLDAKLRGTMRSEIIKLHNNLNATIIYVTHDQTEAMTMASRIVVMKDGYIQQIGSPREVYEHPNNTFVANFIGSPAMNILPAKHSDSKISLGNVYSLKLNKEQEKLFAKFYDDRIAEYVALKNLVLTDKEELLISYNKILSCYITSGYKNENKILDSLKKASKNPLLDLFKKFAHDHVVALSKDGIDQEEVNLVSLTLKKEIAGFNALFDNYLASNTNSLDGLVEQIKYFSIKLKDDYLSKLIEKEKTHFISLLEINKSIFEAVNNVNGDERKYVSSILEEMKKIILSIPKTNQEKLLSLINNLIQEVSNDVIKEDLVMSVNSFSNELNNVVSLSDADIRLLYNVALRRKGKNENIDWMLELVAKSIKSKKRENKLRNEYLINVLIEGLIDEFKKAKGDYDDVLFGIRPEDIHLTDEFNKAKFGKNSSKFKIVISELLGKEYILHLDVGGEKEMICQLPNEQVLNSNDVVELLIDEGKVHVFDPISERIIF